MRRNPHRTNPNDHKRAQKLRQQSSSFEQKLWFALRKATTAKRLKFRRQQPIHPYIADFACMHAKLLIELDGMSHDTQQIHDQTRDTYLRRQGYTVLRVSNDEIVRNLTGVVEKIVTQAEERLRTDSPLTGENQGFTA